MGNTTKVTGFPAKHKDHPHIRGEYDDRIGAMNIQLGSPPYTWGIPYSELDPSQDWGITPIYVGNTLKDP